MPTYTYEEVVALMRPSASYRWLHCPASVGLQLANLDKCPNESSAYADEGTLAHAVAEAILTGKPMPEGLKDKTKEQADEIVGHAREYAEVVRDAIGPDCVLFVEDKVPLCYAPESKGTTDAVVLDQRARVLHIFDLKYGAGVSVVAWENTQLMNYAMGELEKLEGIYETPVTVHLTIYQPRCHDGLPAAREWTISVDELVWRVRAIKDKAESIYRVLVHGKGTLRYAPHDEHACKFCPCGRALVCAARIIYLLVGIPTGDEESIAPEALTKEQIEGILNRSKGITALLGRVEDYALARAVGQGEKWEGWKVVQAVTRRKWTDEGAAEELLGQHLGAEDFIKTSLITPTQAYTLLKKAGRKDVAAEIYGRLSVVPQGGPTLAPVSDKREEYHPVDASMEFSDTQEES